MRDTTSITCACRRLVFRNNLFPNTDFFKRKDFGSQSFFFLFSSLGIKVLNPRMSESVEGSPPTLGKPLRLTTWLSDAGLPNFQLNQPLPAPLLSMFESVLLSMVQGLNNFVHSSPLGAPSTYANVAANHVTQRSSRPTPKPSHPSAPSTSSDSNPPAPVPQKSKMTLHVSNIPETFL